jgi:hypothetical protein
MAIFNNTSADFVPGQFLLGLAFQKLEQNLDKILIK